MKVVIRFLSTDKNPAESKSGAIYRLLDQHPFIFSFCVIFLCWIPYLIFCYPGSSDPYDTLDQLQQMHGIFPHLTGNYAHYETEGFYLNSHHPVFHTLLINGFLDAGAAFGSQNKGFFAFVLMQTLLFVGAFSSTICVIKKMKLSRKLILVLILFYALCPLFPGWAINVTKDTLFTALMVMYVSLLVYALIDREKFFTRKWPLVVLFAIALLLMLTRNNGLVSVLLSAPLFFLLKGRSNKFIAATSLATIVIFLAINSFAFPAMGVAKGSMREALSIPLQQTAAYLTQYDDITPGEEAAIKKLLLVDELNEIAAVYNPRLSDEVKNLYNINASNDELLDYFSAWASMGVRHPQIYLAATFVNVHSYLDPTKDTGWLWLDFAKLGGSANSRDISYMYHDCGFMIEQNTVFSEERAALTAWYKAWQHIPILRLTINMGFCAWTLIFLAAVLLEKKRYRYLIAFAPVLAVILVCLASPADGNVRYALPYISCFPLLACMTFSLVRGRIAKASLPERN